MDTAKEIAKAALLQMKHLKEKGQKLVKSGHVWVGLYRQGVTLAAKTAIIHIDTSSPSKPTHQPIESSVDRKRKAEVAALESVSKKSKPTSSVATETPRTMPGDKWKTLLERKWKEKENKDKNLLSSQTTSQHSTKKPEG